MNRLLQQKRPNQFYIKYILSANAAKIIGSLAGNKYSDDNKNKNKHLLVAYYVLVALYILPYLILIK